MRNTRSRIFSWHYSVQVKSNITQVTSVDAGMARYTVLAIVHLKCCVLDLLPFVLWSVNETALTLLFGVQVETYLLERSLLEISSGANSTSKLLLEFAMLA